MSTAVASGGTPWRWLVTLALPWVVGGWMLREMWAYDVERYYGFSVLPLAGYLFFLWWETAPATSEGRPGAGVGWSLAGVAGALAMGAGILFLAVSPLWTMAGWLMLAGAAAMSLGLLGGVGGWRWVRGAWVPIGFAFTALPWPGVISVPTVACLRGLNAGAAADLVSLLGRPAVAHGAMIETGGGWVGVEESCAGLVGLQTALMLAVFFGELRRLRAPDRVVLAGGAMVIALGVNFARVTWLVWRAAGGTTSGGLAGHDAAGFAELGVAMVAVIAWASLFGKSVGGEYGRAGRGGSAPSFALGRNLIPTGTLVVLLLVIGAWYGRPTAGRPGAGVQWQLVRPPGGWRELTMPPAVSAQLRAERIDYVTWRDRTADRDWIALHVRWGADPAMRYGPGMHGPEACLPNSGARLEANLGEQTVVVDGVPVDFQWLRFSVDGRAFYTFSCIWDPGLARTVKAESLAALDLARERLARVREHRREFGLERMTLAVNQCRDDAEARALLRAMVERLLRRE